MTQSEYNVGENVQWEPDLRGVEAGWIWLCADFFFVCVLESTH